METRKLLKKISTELKSDTAALDAQVLLAHILGKTRTWIMAHPEADVSIDETSQLDLALQRLDQGEPLPYLLGQWEFFGMNFIITPDVLIPRPETELLVEHALKWLGNNPHRRRVLDVGTGSGCIAVTLATRIRDLFVTATDVSTTALRVARKNARRFRVARRIDFIQCDLVPPHPSTLPTVNRFDLICANLPYIPSGKLKHLDVFHREPILALDGGDDGLALIRRLLKEAPRWLAPGGRILLEIEASQGLAVLALAYDAFSEATVLLHKDLAGRDRLVEIRISSQF